MPAPRSQHRSRLRSMTKGRSSSWAATRPSPRRSYVESDLLGPPGDPTFCSLRAPRYGIPVHVQPWGHAENKGDVIFKCP